MARRQALFLSFYLARVSIIFVVEIEKHKDMTYDIIIDGTIGYPYSAKFVADKLKGKSGKPVTVRVDSYGGSVRDAIDIRRQFIDHGDVTCVVTGMTASAATIICTGAARTLIDPCAFMLIHRCSTLVDIFSSLNKEDIAKLTEGLDKISGDLENIDNAIALAYAKKTKKTCEEMLELMDKADWLSAETCVEIGLADALLDEVKPKDAAHAAYANHVLSEIAAAGLTIPAERLAFAAYHVDEATNEPTNTGKSIGQIIASLFTSSTAAASAEADADENDAEEPEAETAADENAADEQAAATNDEEPAATVEPDDADDDENGATEDDATNDEEPAEGVDNLVDTLGVDALLSMPEGLLRLTVAQAVQINDEIGRLRSRIAELEKSDGAATDDIESAEVDDDFAGRVERMYNRLK